VQGVSHILNGVRFLYKILVVDDEPMIVKGLSKIIEKADNIPTVIHTAEDGVQALELIRTMKPHFVFTDIRMPKMDGLELCQRIAEYYPKIKVIVVSGYGEFEYAKKCISCGVTDYILKPITKQAVHAALIKLVEQHKLRTKSAVLTPLKVEEWVGKMVEAIWLLQLEQLEHVMLEWEKELYKYELNPIQLRELLLDFQIMLEKELESRGYYIDKKTPAFNIEDGEEEPILVFNHCLRGTLLLLKDVRKVKSKDMIEEAKKYIDDHLAEEVSLEEVAEILGLNPSYFSQYFKLKTNETFIKYRIKRRIEKAKKLLEIPHYRITDISFEIGYADHPHFTKTFKKHVGMSPSEYRRMLGID
jgi:two-component system response regulator YesN